MTSYHVSPELMPVLEQLIDEGYTVYTYVSATGRGEAELNSLYWYENGRVLDIQPNTWRNRYERDRYNLSVSYKPSRENGSGCRLAGEDTGSAAADLLKFRQYPTWVHRKHKDPENYKGIDGHIKDFDIFTWYTLNRDGTLGEQVNHIQEQRG